MNLVRDTTSEYSCSYSYRRIEMRKQRRYFIIWNRIVGSILLLLSFLCSLCCQTRTNLKAVFDDDMPGYFEGQL